MKDELVKALVREAQKSTGYSIAPYSDFRVGAALVTERGRIYTGCNIENPSLMLSICAEKVALTKALSEGQKKFKALAVVCSKKEYCYPCGSCRQMLLEFAPGIDIFLSSRKGIKKYSLDELLPFAFRKDQNSRH